MPDRDHENYVRDIFERMAESLGMEVGPADPHDAAPGKLRVDLVYPDARPRPLAVEVTRLTSENLRRARVAVVGLAQELHAIAEAEEFGHWTLHVALPINVRDHRDALMEALRGGTEIGGQWSGPIVSFTRHGSSTHQVDWMIGDSAIISSDDAGRSIVEALADNLDKLREAHDAGFETHLVIWSEVGRYFGLMNLVDVPAQTTPAVVDAVWVLSNVDPMGPPISHPLYWYAVPGAERWTPLELP